MIDLLAISIGLFCAFALGVMTGTGTRARDRDSVIVTIHRPTIDGMRNQFRRRIRRDIEDAIRHSRINRNKPTGCPPSIEP